MPTPYYTDDTATLYLGDSLDVLPTLPDASIDAIVTDPPYEIGIAGHAWDSSGIAYNTQLWRECWRILKPGGHLLAFGAPRTYHRLTVAIEDAGFHIIDQLDWIYTHGKPKGADLARAIDRHRDDRDQVLQVTAWLAAARDTAGWTNRQLDALFGTSGMAGLWTTQGKAAIIPKAEQWDRLRAALGFDDTDILPLVADLNARKGTTGDAWGQRQVIGQRTADRRDGGRLYGGFSGDGRITTPHSERARRWEGWNTALRPAHDPIVVARKSTGYDSLVGGLLRHGVGGLNVAACPAAGGGWPTNILLGHDCDIRWDCEPGCPVREMGRHSGAFPVFRLEGRTPAAERLEVGGVVHPTPKPLALMRWLVRLVTPPGGTVLDPFAGSGTTLEACVLEGFTAVGVEREAAYAELCRVRLSKPQQVDLFTA